MSQIEVRLTDAELRSRAETVGEGIWLLKRELCERRVADSYCAAYAEAPLGDDEAAWLHAAAALAGEALA